MELNMLEVARKGPAPLDGIVVLHAWRGSDGSWANGSADLRHGHVTFPLDPDCIPSRVQEKNCRWAGLGVPETVPGSRVRLTGEVYDDDRGTVWTSWHDDANPTPTYYYECDECGLRFSTSMAPDKTTHPVKAAVMTTGFGFDVQRGLFTASDEPGTLTVLLSCDLRSILRWVKLPQASFAYAREYGHLAGRQPVYEGPWCNGYSYAVLRSA
ncbi:hypothetical protein ACFO9E_08090 [Streptomyces maoxianensis]|uniref:Uncharacterized protein n=1 Tax=Streptomyces maoxianensis TaxID=1459942 RepID=A0ABV9G3R4_9ACTN